MTDAPEEPGGLGGLPRTRLTRIEARAMMEGWNVPQAVRAKVLNRLCGIVDPETEHPPGVEPPSLREVIMASRAIIAADLQQQTLNLAARQSDAPAVNDALAGAEGRDDDYQPARPPAADEGDPPAGAPGEVPR